MIYTLDKLQGQSVPFDGKYVFLDIETANSYNDPCQIGAIVCENGMIINTVCELVKPQLEFGDFNIKIHKITPEMVKDSPDFRVVWEQHFSFIDRDTIIVGHNIKDDVREITTCLHNLGLDIIPLTYIDTCDIVQRCFSKEYIENNVKLKMKNGKPSEHYRLKTMAKLLKLPAPNHNALIDCITEINLFSYLYTNHKDKLTLGDGKFYSFIGNKLSKSQEQLQDKQPSISFRDLRNKLNEFLDLLYGCVPDEDGEIWGTPVAKLQDWFDENACLISQVSIEIHQKINSIIDDGKITEQEFEDIETQIYNYLNR